MFAGCRQDAAGRGIRKIPQPCKLSFSGGIPRPAFFLWIFSDDDSGCGSEEI